MLTILLILAALINIGFGLASYFAPEPIAKATGFQLIGERGTSELRIAFGGYFIGMGVALLVLNDPQASAAIGIAWAGAAVTRLVELVVRDRAALLNRSFWIIWATEVITAAMLFAQLTA
jgi:hypothetical protein